MSNRSIMHSAGRWIAIAALVSGGWANAQNAEPSLNQVYEAAHAGKLEQAQVMMQQVLVAHPNSAKAHFVQAELSAGLGHLARAREELALADKLAPGLPFAKPEAVQKLRTQLNSGGSTLAPAHPASPAPVQVGKATEPTGSSFPWGIALALGGGLVAYGIYAWGKKGSATTRPQYTGAGLGTPAGSGLSGPQTFGAGPAYGQQPYAQPNPYGQAPASSGLGGRVAGGLATGLAVGAGVMAAQAIGKSLMGNDDRPTHSNASADDYQPIASNNDFGGDNFGVNDGSSWDDGGGTFASNDGGGNDWDS